MAKIALVLTQGFADWEYAFIAGTGVPFYGFDVRFFAPEAGVVRSQGGLEAMVPHGLNEIVAWAPDVLVVVGGSIWASPDAPDIGELLKAYHTAGGTVAGICGGSLALARAGILDATPHTSNDADFLAENAAGYAGGACYCQSTSAVVGERVITAPGTAPVSFTSAVFAAAGLDESAVAQFRSMLAAEHG